MIVKAYELVLPIVASDLAAVNLGGPTLFPTKQICGTAFAIAPGIYMTAAHVLAQAKTFPSCGLGYPHEDGVRFRRADIGKIEMWDDCDIAIFESLAFDRPVSPWKQAEQPMLTEVTTVGFPYAWDAESTGIVTRAFTGYVVSMFPWPKLPTRPKVYELSFLCPRGISGAPIYVADGDKRFGSVAGVIIGNNATDMEIATLREVDKDGGITTVYSKTETLHMGIAVAATSLAGRYSAILGKPLSEVTSLV